MNITYGGLKMRFGRLILSVGLIGCVLFSAIQVSGGEAATVSPKTAEPNAPASEPNGPPPKITVEQPIYDFGYISPGSKNTCEFKFQNNGVGKLIISEITKTCGCTVPTLDKKEYAPGESGAIKVEYHADQGAGIRTRHLYILSNDPVNPRVDLTIKAAIVQKVISEPERIEYTLKGAKACLAEITIKSVDDKPFAITKFESTSDAVTATFDPNQKETKFTLQAKLNPQKMATNTSGRIEIVITHPDCTSVTIPFSILSRFRADPPSINVLNSEPGKVVKKELWILDNYEQDFEIASINVSQGIIKVLGQEKMGNRYKIDLEITPPPAQNTARMFTDALTITTKDGEVINVACRGFYVRK
jgi:hypothetical protein